MANLRKSIIKQKVYNIKQQTQNGIKRTHKHTHTQYKNKKKQKKFTKYKLNEE